MSSNYYQAVSHVLTYSKFRPNPPVSLVQEIVKFVQKKIPNSLGIAADVGCGSGQSTNILAPYFSQVIGLDPSPEIIQEANSNQKKEGNVQFRVSPAEQLPFENETMDLITTAQAVHWFDLSKFYPEVNRVLKKDGVLAIYGYNLPEPIGQDGDTKASGIVRKYYEEVLGSCILEGSRKTYLENYKGAEFNEIPFVENGLMVRKENFITTVNVSVSDVTGYISSWSGFQNYVSKNGEKAGDEVLKQFEVELSKALGKSSEQIVPIQYRYFLLIGRKS